MEDYALKSVPLDRVVLEDFDRLKSERIVNFWVPFYEHMSLLYETAKIASGKERPFLVDVGCGSGLCSKLFFDVGFDVLAIDLNKRNVEEARIVYGKNGLEFAEGSAEDLVSIVKSHGKEDVDVTYCSYMPEGKNLTQPMLDLKPGIVLHVISKYEDMWATGTEDAFKPGDGYSAHGFIPLISGRDLNNLDAYSLETAGTWLIVQIRNDLLEALTKKHVTFKELYEYVKAGMPTIEYSWEPQLEKEMKRVVNKARTLSRTLAAR